MDSTSYYYKAYTKFVTNHLDIKKVISRKDYHQSHNRLNEKEKVGGIIMNNHCHHMKPHSS
jgi:hypothetical protein